MNTKNHITLNIAEQPTLTLALGDCLKVAYELPARSIDLVLCDLPYGVTQHKWDSVIPLEELWAAYQHVCKPDANIVLFAVQPFATVLAASKPNWLRDDLVWVKNKCSGHLNSGWRPLRQHEQVFVFRQEGRGTYNPQKTYGHAPANAVNKRSATGQGTYGAQRNGLSTGGSTERFPTSVLQFPKVNNDDPDRRHPHQKPVPLLQHLIETYSNPGDTVFDSTMGSGATGIACLNTGRHFVGAETSRQFFDLAEQWLLSTACPEYPKLFFQNAQPTIAKANS